MNGSDFIEICEKHGIDPDSSDAGERVVSILASEVDWIYDTIKEQVKPEPKKKRFGFSFLAK
jgi:hypothetical protein